VWDIIFLARENFGRTPRISAVMDRSRPGRPARPGLALIGAGLITLPGILIRLAGARPVDWIAALGFGLAIVGAAFLLGWGAEVVQLDISAGLALAVLALIACCPNTPSTSCSPRRPGRIPRSTRRSRWPT
jgi:hypothetical protein